MIRGTDTQFDFNLPYQCSELQSIKITFWQKENKGPSALRPMPIVKTLEECIIADKRLSVILDREETLRFSDKRKAYVQLVGTTLKNITFASPQQMITVYPICDESLDENEEYVYLDGREVLDYGEGAVYGDGGNLNVGSYNVSANSNASVTATYYRTANHLEITGVGEMKNWSTSNPAPWNSYMGDIRSISIDQGVTNIGAYAFVNCIAATNVLIPGSVTHIGDYAFSGCASISHYDFTEFTAIPTLDGANVFNGILDTCRIEVPATLYDDWIADESWLNYASQIVSI